MFSAPTRTHYLIYLLLPTFYSFNNLSFPITVKHL